MATLLSDQRAREICDEWLDTFQRGNIGYTKHSLHLQRPAGVATLVLNCEGLRLNMDGAASIHRRERNGSTIGGTDQFDSNVATINESTAACLRRCAADWHETIAVLTLLSCCRGYGADENPDFWTSVIARYDHNSSDNAMWRLARTKTFPCFYFNFEDRDEFFLPTKGQRLWLEALFASTPPSTYFKAAVTELMHFVDDDRFRQRSIDVHIQLGSGDTVDYLEDGDLEAITCMMLALAGDASTHTLPMRLCSVNAADLQSLPLNSAHALSKADEMKWVATGFPIVFEATDESSRDLRRGFATFILAATSADRVLPNLIDIGSEDDPVNIGFVSGIASALRISTKSLMKITLPHMSDLGSNSAFMYWMAYGMFHPSSICNLEELEIERYGECDSKTFDLVDEVMAMENPARVLLGLSEDMTQLTTAGVEFPATQTRVKLAATTSFMMLQPLFPLKDSSVTLEVDCKDQNSDAVFEILALTRDHACVLIPGYGYGWVPSGLVESTWCVACDLKQPRSVKKFNAKGDLASFTRLLRVMGSGVVSLQWDYVSSAGPAPPNEVVLEALACCPQLKVAQLPSEYLSTLAQACQDGLCGVEALELDMCGSSPFPMVQLHALLTDLKHPCTRLLRELRVINCRLPGETIEPLVDILKKNKVLRDIQMQIWAWNLEPLAKFDNERLFPDVYASRKLAFVSTASRLGHDVFVRIFEFVGKPVNRRLSLKSADLTPTTW